MLSSLDHEEERAGLLQEVQTLRAKDSVAVHQLAACKAKNTELGEELERSKNEATQLVEEVNELLGIQAQVYQCHKKSVQLFLSLNELTPLQLRADLAAANGGIGGGLSKFGNADGSLLPGNTLRQTHAALVADLENEIEALRASDAKQREVIVLLELKLGNSDAAASEEHTALRQVAAYSLL